MSSCVKNTRADSNNTHSHAHIICFIATQLNDNFGFHHLPRANCRGSVNPIQSVLPPSFSLSLPACLPPSLAIILIPFMAIYRGSAALTNLFSCVASTTNRNLGSWQLCVNDRIKRNPNINYALINFIYLSDFVSCISLLFWWFCNWVINFAGNVFATIHMDRSNRNRNRIERHIINWKLFCAILGNNETKAITQLSRERERDRERGRMSKSNAEVGTIIKNLQLLWLFNESNRNSVPRPRQAQLHSWVATFVELCRQPIYHRAENRARSTEQSTSHPVLNLTFHQSTWAAKTAQGCLPFVCLLLHCTISRAIYFN